MLVVLVWAHIGRVHEHQLACLERLVLRVHEPHLILNENDRDAHLKGDAPTYALPARCVRGCFHHAGGYQ
jgi:hypothetical protein